MWTVHSIKADGMEVELPFSIELDEEIVKEFSNYELKNLFFMYIIATLCKEFKERLEQK